MPQIVNFDHFGRIENRLFIGNYDKCLDMFVRICPGYYKNWFGIKIAQKIWKKEFPIFETFLCNFLCKRWPFGGGWGQILQTNRHRTKCCIYKRQKNNATRTKCYQKITTRIKCPHTECQGKNTTHTKCHGTKFHRKKTPHRQSVITQDWKNWRKWFSREKLLRNLSPVAFLGLPCLPVGPM